MTKRGWISPAVIGRVTSVHSWIGIVTGMALFIAFFAGALTLYEDDLKYWANPTIRATSSSPGALDELVTAVGETAIGKNRFSVSLGKHGQAYATVTERRSGSRSISHTLYLDDSTGALNRTTISTVASRIDELHMALGMPRRPGYILMGVVSAVYALALITGLIIHLPKLVETLYALRLGKNLKKMWLDTHALVGTLSLPFHLMIAVTAVLLCIQSLLGSAMTLTMLSDKPAKAYAQKQAENVMRRRGEVNASQVLQSAAMLPASALVRIARDYRPGFIPTSITYRNYGTDRAEVTVNGIFDKEVIAQSAITISPINGTIGKVDVPGQRSTIDVVRGTYRTLHYGEYGGEIIRSLYLVLGLGGALLFYSGNLLWIETRRRRGRLEQTRSSWMMAQLSVGVCAGCCLGIALMLFGARLTPDHWPDRGSWEWAFYYVGFLGSLFFALFGKPIRTGVELLYGCAAAYASLPVLDLVLTPQQGSLESIRTNGIFLLLAGGFFICGRVAHRRRLEGQPNSVWSDNGVPAYDPSLNVSHHKVACADTLPKKAATQRFVAAAYRWGFFLSCVAIAIFGLAGFIDRADLWRLNAFRLSGGLGLSLLALAAVVEAWNAEPHVRRRRGRSSEQSTQ